MTTLDCGHEPTPTANTPGYALTRDGRTICYADADAEQRKQIEQPGPFSAYLSSDLRSVTTWTGGALARVVGYRTYRNGLTGSRMAAVSVVTPGGRRMHGRYGPDWSGVVTLR